MRNLMKLIAVTAMTALLLFALVTCASADEKIYTSPVFRLPRERLERAEEIFEAQEEEAGPEEAEEPAEEPAEETAEEPAEAPAEEGNVPGTEAEEPAESPAEEPAEAPAEEGTASGEEAAEPAGEDTVPGEKTEAPEEEADGDEDFEELGDDAGEVTGEPARPKREVIIHSTQGAVVTEGDQITMTSELRGFGDDEQVAYQWQVDRGDGAGWVDVNGATKFKYTFIANEETIKYSWRLVVNVIE